MTLEYRMAFLCFLIAEKYNRTEINQAQMFRSLIKMWLAREYFPASL